MPASILKAFLFQIQHNDIRHLSSSNIISFLFSSSSIYVKWKRERERVCVCVSVWVKTDTLNFREEPGKIIDISLSLQKYQYPFPLVGWCVCVCERERERERELSFRHPSIIFISWNLFTHERLFAVLIILNELERTEEGSRRVVCLQETNDYLYTRRDAL